jgi:hypothetical protein
MYYRKIRPRTTCLYSAASIAPATDRRCSRGFLPARPWGPAWQLCQWPCVYFRSSAVSLRTARLSGGRKTADGGLEGWLLPRPASQGPQDTSALGTSAKRQEFRYLTDEFSSHGTVVSRKIIQGVRGSHNLPCGTYFLPRSAFGKNSIQMLVCGSCFRFREPAFAILLTFQRRLGPIPVG